MTGPLASLVAIPAPQQEELQGREMLVGLPWGGY